MTRTLWLIDGRSGSGKTTLAAQLAQSHDAQLLSLDECYPGWDGLSAAEDIVVHSVLGDFLVPVWDWHENRVSHTRRLDADRSLVIEGCGSLTPAIIHTATQRFSEVNTLWVECDEVTRKRRALERDGDMFAPHWDSWARQEEAHARRNWPVSRARWIIYTGDSIDCTGV